MRKITEQEIKILKQLVRNPRTSDNNISKNTGVPVMTVNRKRKQMEKEGILNYHTVITYGDPKTKIFKARQLYTIQLKIGITKDQYIKAIKEDDKFKYNNLRYHANSYLGEQDGHLAIIIMLEADTQSELMEVFNGDVIPHIKARYGEDCINKIETVRLDIPIRIHHNYIPLMNIDNGIIKSDWQDEWIYVGEELVKD